MNRVRDMRKIAGIRRVEDLAEAIGLSRPTLTRIERNESSLNWRHAQAIARVLRCRPADLYVDETTPSCEREAAEIARALEQRSPASLERWLAIGRDLIE